MPNHFLTVGLCARDYSAAEAKGLDDYSEIDFTPLTGANLCEVLRPLPKELQGIVSANPPCRYRHKETGEYWPGNNGAPYDRRNEFDRVPLTDDERAELKAKHGAVTWYEWQCEHWGTKWGTYDLKVHELGGDGSPVLIEFQTAWCQPSPEMMRLIDDHLCSEYCLTSITWVGHDPGCDETVPIEVAEKPPVPADSL